MIYGESLRRLAANQDLPPKTLADTAGIVRSFVEDYHEKLEEDYLFPRFKQAGKLADLVGVLADQHQAGRRLTDTTLRLATAQAMKTEADRDRLAESLRLFIRMYGPHAAREDTVLFPAMHGVITAREYDTLGDEFEKKEQQLFGADGFEHVVERIAATEKSLGIYDLATIHAAGVTHGRVARAKDDGDRRPRRHGLGAADRGRSVSGRGHLEVLVAGRPGRGPFCEDRDSDAGADRSVCRARWKLSPGHWCCWGCSPGLRRSPC